MSVFGGTSQGDAGERVLDNSPRAPFPDGPLPLRANWLKIRHSSRQLAKVRYS
jgi:hypothetical protein